MFNLGPEKILVILAIALVVLGPDKLPEAARKVGQVLGNLRRLSGGFEHEIRQALDEPMQAFHREFSMGERPAPAETVAVGAPGTNGASSEAPSPTADPAVPADGSVAADPAKATDPAAAEPAPPADGATPAGSAPADDAATSEEPAAQSPPGTATHEPPSRPAHEPAGTTGTTSLPGWVFGRAGDDSGPAFH